MRLIVCCESADGEGGGNGFSDGVVLWSGQSPALL